MHLRPVLFLTTFLLACQSAPPDSAASGSTPGTTTTTRGTPTVTRSDTTRTGGGATAPGSASGGVTLTLDRASYARDATVTMRLASQSRDTLGYNPCANRVVERQDGDRWEAYAELERMCTMELRLLMPGETQTATTDLPGNVRAGTHRIVLTLQPQSSAGGAAVRAISPTFRVN